MTATLVANVSIFDGTGAPLFPGEMLIESGRIKAVARGAAALMGMADTPICWCGGQSGKRYSLAAEQSGADAHFAERAFLYKRPETALNAA